MYSKECSMKLKSQTQGSSWRHWPQTKFNVSEFKMEKSTNKLSQNALWPPNAQVLTWTCVGTHISKYINTNCKRKHLKQNQLIMISYIFLADFTFHAMMYCVLIISDNDQRICLSKTPCSHFLLIFFYFLDSLT